MTISKTEKRRRMDITDMNVAIAKALGLDPTKISKGGVTITLDGELGPVLEVKYKVWDEAMVNKFTGALVRYKLVEIEDDGADSGDRRDQP